jgi:hypothetical protein
MCFDTRRIQAEAFAKPLDEIEQALLLWLCERRAVGLVVNAFDTDGMNIEILAIELIPE